jgi:hypothetical protein
MVYFFRRIYIGNKRLTAVTATRSTSHEGACARDAELAIVLIHRHAFRMHRSVPDESCLDPTQQAMRRHR